MIRAVLFDLFGTLVDNMTNAQVDDFRRMTAEALRVPGEEYSAGWTATFTKRARGEYGSVENAIRAAAEYCPTPYYEDGMQEALAIRKKWMEIWMTPREGACSTILALRNRGLRIGLLSNCSEDVPEMWSSTPLASLIDEPLFSCSEGLRKPTPEFYLRALERLRVSAPECLYVADGDNGELAAATKIGMRTLMIRPSNLTDEFRTHSEEDWEGPCIERLSELLNLA